MLDFGSSMRVRLLDGDDDTSFDIFNGKDRFGEEGLAGGIACLLGDVGCELFGEVGFVFEPGSSALDA